jgi:signal peptidase II
MQERGAVAPLSAEVMSEPVTPRTRATTRPARVRNVVVAVGIAMLVVALDQTTKTLALDHVHGPTHVWGPFGLALGYNSGSAFSLFTGQPALLAVLAGAAVVALVVLVWRSSSLLLVLGCGLLLGGTIGNLSDRLARAYHGDVVDFITLTHWPTFNVADCAITAGIVLLVVALVFFPGRLRAP